MPQLHRVVPQLLKVADGKSEIKFILSGCPLYTDANSDHVTGHTAIRGHLTQSKHQAAHCSLSRPSGLIAGPDILLTMNCLGLRKTLCVQRGGRSRRPK
jgi:hypothetical protein